MLELQRQPNPWSCTPTAFAIAANIPVATLIEWIGHDGSDMMYPELGDTLGRRAFSAQECIIPLLLNLGKAFVSIEVEQECFLDEDKSYVISCDDATLAELLDYSNAVLSGRIHGKVHSVAWCRESRQLYDPAGFLYPLHKMKISYLYLAPRGLS